MTKKKPWAYVKCRKCGSSVPCYEATCQKCGTKTPIGKPITCLTSGEILKLLRLPSEHPNQHGYPYSRMELLEECKNRGKKLLEQLGWPASPNAIYWNRHTGSKTSLRAVCETWQWSGFRHVMHEREEELNKLTKGEFYGNCASVGVECSTVTEWRRLMKKYPETKEKLREAVRLHKGFYEHYVADGKPIAEYVKEKKGTECEQNIERLARWLKIDVNKAETIRSLPKLDIYYGVWSLVEHYSPKPDLNSVTGQVRMDVFCAE